MAGRPRPWPWAAVAAAAIAPWAMPGLPPAALVVALGGCGLSLLLARGTRLAGTCVLAACWTLSVAHLGIANRLPAERAGQIVEVTGTVVGLPEAMDEGVRFRFRPDRHGAGGALPRSLRVTWYEDAPPLRADQRWRLVLRVQPPRQPVNFAGRDGERWLFAEGIGALASVRSGTPLGQARGSIHGLREKVRDRVRHRWAQRPDIAGLLQGLIIGHAAAVPREVRETLVATGTGHLLAISGLHVGLAGAGGFWLARAAAPFAPRALQAGRLAWPAALAAATLYAALAGFGVSTRRALVMLAVVAAAALARRRVAAGRAFLLALVAVLALDPRAPLQAGFWLSFAAVFVLGWLFHPATRRRGPLPMLARAQLGLGLAMMPLVLAWGFPLAPSGLLANLVAVPAVSLAVVPLALAGTLALAVFAPLGEALLGAAGHVVGVLAALLGWFAAAPALAPRLAPPPAGLALVAALGAALAFLTPLATRWRLVALLAPLALWAPRPPDTGERRIALDVLDVGQGTAVVLRHGRTAWLYDTGPGHPQRWDRVDAVIEPALRAAGHPAPDRVFVSHADLDHAGGLATLRRRYPRAPVFAQLRSDAPGLHGCVAGLRLGDGGLDAAVLHPSPFLPYLGNDASCVLSVAGPGGTVLLPGDVGAAAEARLVLEGLVRHDVVLVPHHGSLSSSTAAFVTALRPRLALVTSGAGNRFGFPRPEVTARWAAAGARVADTGACGGLRVRLGPDGDLEIAGARRARGAPWRWPAAPGCP